MFVFKPPMRRRFLKHDELAKAGILTYSKYICAPSANFRAANSWLKSNLKRFTFLYVDVPPILILVGFNIAVPVGIPPPDTDIVGADVNRLPTAGKSIAVITPLVNVHVVVAYPPPPDNIIVGAEVKPVPPFVIVNAVSAVLPAFIVGVIFIKPPPLNENVGCDTYEPCGKLVPAENANAFTVTGITGVKTNAPVPVPPIIYTVGAVE